MIDPSDMRMLVYFWEQKDDIERYTGFEDMKPALQAEYPEVLNAWSDYIASRRIVGAVLRDAYERSQSKPSAEQSEQGKNHD